MKRRQHGSYCEVENEKHMYSSVVYEDKEVCRKNSLEPVSHDHHDVEYSKEVNKMKETVTVKNATFFIINNFLYRFLILLISS